MTTPEFESLLVFTIAAAWPGASPTELAKFNIAWTKYSAIHSSDAHAQFVVEAESFGFKRKLDKADAICIGLVYVRSALIVSLRKCEMPKKYSSGEAPKKVSGGGGPQRHFPRER